MDSIGHREAIAGVFEDHLAAARTEKEEIRKGELGLRTRPYSLPSTPANFGWRKAREKEVLGLSISERPTLVILPSGLSDADWGYVRAAVAANPGMSQFFVSVGLGKSHTVP